MLEDVSLDNRRDVQMYFLTRLQNALLVISTYFYLNNPICCTQAHLTKQTNLYQNIQEQFG